MSNRPYILTIAGLDPSSGAGLTSDLKTVEALKGYGLSVCTSITVQNEETFVKSEWVSIDLIKEQISVLIDKYPIEFVKIGIVENWEILLQMVEFLKSKNKNIKIVLDPILKASTSFKFHGSSSEHFTKVLSHIFLLTPNFEEIQSLYKDKNIEETIAFIRSKTNILLKGGHRLQHLGKDELYTKDKHYTLNPKGLKTYPKHGSGCILSSAVTTYLGLGQPLLKACYKAKKYTEKALDSNKTLLAYHR